MIVYLIKSYHIMSVTLHSIHYTNKNRVFFLLHEIQTPNIPNALSVHTYTNMNRNLFPLKTTCGIIMVDIKMSAFQNYLISHIKVYSDNTVQYMGHL